MSDPATRRSLVFLVLLVFLNLQRDGFRLAAEAGRNQRFLLPLTLFFCACLGLLLAIKNDTQTTITSPLARRPNPRLLHGLAIAWTLPASLLFVASARYYARFGYALHPAGVLLVSAGTAIGLALCFRSKRPALPLFTVALLAYLAWTLLSVWSFPLSIQRSDMLPLLSAADTVLLHGGNPYRLYTFPSESVYLTYLPGTLLAFVPAPLLHLDPRLLNCVCVLLLAVLLYRATDARYRYTAAALLVLWVLSPYLLYRHELYTEPHWLALVASLVLLRRGRSVLADVLFGISIGLSQFSWILFPFYLLYALQAFGWRRAARSAAVSLLPAAILTLPFLLWSPHAFLFGVLSHWQTQEVAARPVNFSFFLAKLVGAPHLQAVQAAGLALLLLTCTLRGACRSFAGMLRAMSLALAGFILCNILVWGYFFLLLELVLLLYLFAANGWLRPPELKGPALPPLDRSPDLP